MEKEMLTKEESLLIDIAIETVSLKHWQQDKNRFVYHLENMIRMIENYLENESPIL